MADTINYASLHRPELLLAILHADEATRAAIDADLAREGWTPNGVIRSLIRDTELLDRIKGSDADALATLDAELAAKGIEDRHQHRQLIALHRASTATPEPAP
jgi:hypothetical protein